MSRIVLFCPAVATDCNFFGALSSGIGRSIQGNEAIWSLRVSITARRIGRLSASARSAPKPIASVERGIYWRLTPNG